MQIIQPEQLAYQGRFSGQIEGREEIITGQASVVIGDDGLPDIDVTIAANSTSYNVLDEVYQPNGMMIPTNRVKWISAKVESTIGVFEVKDRVFLQGREIVVGSAIPQPQRLRLGALRAEFEAKNASSPHYWMLPLYNLIWNASLLRYHELDDHPLWLPHNVPHDVHSDLNPVSPPPVIAFRFDGEPAFIQCVKEYEDLKQQLQGGSRQRAITSVMVGSIGQRTFDFEKSDPTSWFPMHLLSWLSLAVGCFVGAPWIDLLDETGNLVRRIHLKFSQPAFQCGVNQFQRIWTSDAIGYLLTKALDSPQFG